MKRHASLHVVFAIFFALALSACGSDPLREQVTPGLLTGSEILGEVVTAVALKDILRHRDFSGYREDLLATGVPAEEIVEGSEVIVFSYCYAHNSRVGCKHGGRYVAHVAADLREKLGVGSIVSAKLTLSDGRWPLARISEVFGKVDDPALDCTHRRLDYRGLASFSPYGPPIGGWLECKGIQAQGWVRKCVAGAPPPGPASSQTDCVSELQRPPAGR